MSINISSHPAVFRWQPACVLQVRGADAANFLQGQFTNDLRPLGENQAVYGLWLTVKGKVLADSFVVRGPGDLYWVVSYACAAEVIRQRLESFIIADDVVVEDVTAAWRGYTVFGEPQSGERPPGALVFAGRRASAPHEEWLVPVDAVPRVEPSFGSATWLSGEDMLRRRIEAGIPAVPTDVGPNDLPNEAGLDETAISYTKGCYLGQEVMARLRSMGQVRRRLVRTESDAPKPASLPAPVFVGDRTVGEIRSAVGREGGFDALTMVTFLHLSGGTQAALAPGGTPCVRFVLP